ncbi:ABC transporter permease, partial [Enterococcus faecalis]|nr:ABC transporter permease [Enterococcus faecalis]
MNKYISIAEANFKSIIKYKASIFLLIMQALTQFIVMASLWEAIFKNTTVVQGYNYYEMIQYYFGVTVLSYFCFYAVDWELNEDVHSGHFGIILLKPCSIMTYYFSKMIGDRVANIIFGLLPISFLWLIFIRGDVPFSFINLFLGLASILLAMILWFLLSFSFAMLSFWLENIFFILTVKEILIQFISGIIIPINFFPDYIQKIFWVLPFRYIAFEPMQ